MDPGAQLWGWLVAYAIYDMLAILLPSIALEEANLTENDRLQSLVDEKTIETFNVLLSKTFETTDNELRNKLEEGIRQFLKEIDEKKQKASQKIQIPEKK